MSAVLSSTPYRALTEKIVEAMKGDLRAFKMPWHTGDQPAQLPVNASTDAPYRGVNVLSLWISAMQGRYPSGYWASYKQWQSIGAQVRKGERGLPDRLLQASGSPGGGERGRRGATALRRPRLPRLQ